MTDRCPKVPHIGMGYMHEEDDDGPFVIDGVTYCGRCHLFGCPSIAPESELPNQLRDRVAQLGDMQGPECPPLLVQRDEARELASFRGEQVVRLRDECDALRARVAELEAEVNLRTDELDGFWKAGASDPEGVTRFRARIRDLESANAALEKRLAERECVTRSDAAEARVRELENDLKTYVLHPASLLVMKKKYPDLF